MTPFFKLLPCLCFLFVAFGGPLAGEELEKKPETSQVAPLPSKEAPPFPSEQLSKEKMLRTPSFEEKEDDTILNNSRFTGEFMKMLFFLGLIVAFMLIGSYFLKKMIHTRVQQVNQDSAVKVIEQRALSSKTTLYLLNVNDQEILIAESPSGVVSLGQLKTVSNRE